VGIPYPLSRDGNSAGTGAGQPKTPRRTPVSITIIIYLIGCFKHPQLDANLSLNSSLNLVLNCEFQPPNQVIMWGWGWSWGHGKLGFRIGLMSPIPKPQLQPQLWKKWFRIAVKLRSELKVELRMFETPYCCFSSLFLMCLYITHKCNSFASLSHTLISIHQTFQLFQVHI